MSTRTDRGWLIPVGIIGGVVLLALACGIGAAGGYLLGQRNATRVSSVVPRIQITRVPGYKIPTPGIPQGIIPQLGSGVLITAVTPDSPADKAGVRVGDAIVAVDGTAVSPDRTLADMIGTHKPGDKVTIRISRNGREEELQVTLAAKEGEADKAYLGVTYPEFSMPFQDQKQFD
jgi:membrane-associated protease RseP (regulator of RpoE activity)